MKAVNTYQWKEALLTEVYLFRTIVLNFRTVAVFSFLHFVFLINAYYLFKNKK